MTRMANGHDVGKEKRGARARGANGHPCEVVSYNRLATPAGRLQIINAIPPNYFPLYFLKPAIN
jgi:hypothetical protein